MIFRKAFVVPHTHWDREWYLPFEGYRQWLVSVMDVTLDMLISGELERFTLDGQSVPLEDYLEVRPERRSDVDRLIRDHKLVVGPWYTQPDEWIPSGESLIRNLLYGMKVAQIHGGTMRVGYLPDSFGHVATLPTILSQFGLRVFVFYRGLADEDLGDEFYWESPSGDRVVAIFMRKGYCSANALGLNDPYSPLYLSSASGLAFRLKGQVPSEPDVESGVSKLRQVVDEAQKHSALGVYLIPNGCDHMAPQKLKHILERAREAMPDVELKVGDLDEYATELISRLGSVALKTYRGELRGARFTMVDYGVLTTRADIKLMNFAAEKALTGYAEPLSAVMKALGGRPRSLEHAWKLLLQSQAHDSICSTGVDEVNEQVAERLTAAFEAAMGASLANMEYLSNVLKLSDTKNEGPTYFIFNPVNKSRSDLVEIVDTGKGESGGVAFAEEDVASGSTGKIIKRGFVATVPAIGYSFVTAHPEVAASGQAASSGAAGDGSEGVPNIENEHFTVSMAADGTLKVVDKNSNKRLQGLALLLDGGDSGDEYAYNPPNGDAIFKSAGSLKQVSARRFPGWQELHASLVMRVPASLEGDKRSAELVDLPVEVVVRVISGVRRIDMEITINNTAKDHRMQLAFIYPNLEKVLASTAFGVVTHKYGELPSGKEGAELPAKSYAFKGWCAGEAGKEGLMVVAPGVYECWAGEVDGEKALMITLYRSIGWLSRSDLSVRKGGAGPHIETPASQVLKKMRFRVSIIPYMGEPPYQEAEAFMAPLLAIPAGENALPSSSGSFVSLPQEAVLTSLKPSEDGSGIVIRVYNPTERAIEGPMSFAFPVDRVLLSLMDERDGEEVPVKHVNEYILGYFIRLPPGSVETFKVLLAKASDRSA